MHYLEKFKAISSYFQGKINLELVARFECDISVFEQSSNDNILYYYSSSTNSNFCIYYKNYKIYEKYKSINISGKEGKKEVLIFMNDTLNALKINNYYKFKIETFLLKDEYREKDINYLISENDFNNEFILSEDEDSEDIRDEIIDESEMTTIDFNDIQNFQNKDVDYEFKKDLNKYNYLIVYDKQAKSPKRRSDKNISDNPIFEEEEDFEIFDKKEKELIDTDINFNNKRLKPYLIDKKIYNELVNGNHKVYQNLKDEINKEINKQSKKDTKLLNKKRYNSSTNNIKIKNND